MNVTVIGIGYVGLVTGTALAALKHHVTCVDVDEGRIKGLQRGAPHFYEQGLEAALKREMDSGRITFTPCLESTRRNPDVIFICVGTPSGPGGEADLAQLKAAVQQCARHVRHRVVLAVKSTVPVGTSRWIEEYLAGQSFSGVMGRRRSLGSLVSVVSNPEFLREGSALADSLNPDRIVIGARRTQAAKIMKRLFRDLDSAVVCVDPEDAELIKYASNAFLALKVSFANALADFCEHCGADVRQVTTGVGLDPRIGFSFLGAGLGFGGSCFPKDLRSLLYQFRDAGLHGGLFEEVLRINDDRITRAVAKLRESFTDLEGKRVALLGLAFKPHSDDVRESQSLRLLEALQAQGCIVSAYDPKGMANARVMCPSAIYCTGAVEAAKDADAVVIATDWPEFKQLPWRRMLQLMRGRTIIDCRNVLDEAELARYGARYIGTGVPQGGRGSR